MHSSFRTNWISGAVVPAIYLALELAFNFQLTNIAANTVSDQTLAGLEFWSRIISGIGLGLLIYRLILNRLTHKVIPLIICLIVGVTLMWNVQRELTEYLVKSALPADKTAAVALSILAADAADGHLKTLKGDSIVGKDINSLERRAVMALFPAAALHSENRTEQIESWLRQKPKAYESHYSYQFDAENAYKNLIIPPIALGLSILFAVLNLALLISYVVERYYKRNPLVLRLLIFSALVILSIQGAEDFISSDGYQKSLRPGLWESKPVLAVLVEWSGSAIPTWGSISEFSSEVLLFGYSFKKPSWSPL